MNLNNNREEEEKQSKGIKGETEEVELIQNKFTKNIASPFINKSKNWDDQEHWNIPEDIQSNIRNNLGFLQPSNIQAVSIPLITQAPHHDLIAQAKNGCGKTGSFAIGTVLRIDRENPNT
jgi:superfamily II DNA/RNA helicase